MNETIIYETDMYIKLTTTIFMKFTLLNFILRRVVLVLVVLVIEIELFHLIYY